MKSPKLIFALSLTSLALGATLYAEDTELPERAARTIASRFPGAKVVEVEVEAPGLYEVELSKDGEEIEALVSSRGVIFEVERPASLPALPARLARAIRSAAGTSPIEELSRKERCAEVRAVKLAKPRRVFEVVVEQGGRIGVVEITADGEVVEKLRWKAMRTPRRKDDDQGRDDDDDDGEDEDDDDEDDDEDEDEDDGDEDDDDGDGDEDGDEDDDDDEDKRRLIRLPEPCRARLRQAFAGAKLLAVEVELEEGLLVFEAKLRRKGKAFSVAMDRKGTVLETEAKVDRTELTRAAAAKLKELAPGAAIVEVEEERILAEVKTRIFEQAKVFYEVETEGREFLIDARGKLVTSDDEGEQNDDDDDDDDDDDSEDDDDDR